MFSVLILTIFFIFLTELTSYSQNVHPQREHRHDNGDATD